MTAIATSAAPVGGAGSMEGFFAYMIIAVLILACIDGLLHDSQGG